MNTKSLLFCSLAVIFGMGQADADDINFGKQTPSANQVINALKPAAANPTPEDADDGYEGDIDQDSKSRSIDMSSMSASTPKVAKKKLKKEIHTAVHKTNAEQVAFSMEILFAYKSSDLTEVAKSQLNPVGEALASDSLKALSFIVEGHTDAVGGNTYNINLSKERASAVKQYLVDAYHITPARIKIEGKGKSNLLDPNNPDSEVNRRVRIVAIR